jgi:hypothetical protein
MSDVNYSGPLLDMAYAQGRRSPLEAQGGGVGPGEGGYVDPRGAAAAQVARMRADPVGGGPLDVALQLGGGPGSPLAMAAGRMMDRLKRFGLCYLATPYTNYQAGLDAAFADACRLAAILTHANVGVFSPIAHCHPIMLAGELDPTDHSYWLPRQRPFMDRADVLLIGLLDGWAESFGINYEHEIFHDAWKPIFTIHPETLVVNTLHRQ